MYRESRLVACTTVKTRGDSRRKNNQGVAEDG